MTTIHQFVTGATPGNAIYNEALIMQQVLRRWGLRSDIFAERIHPSLQKTVAHYEQYRPQPDDMLLFHYSLGSALSDYVLELPQKLILRYHNVTPPHFLVGANPWLRAGAAYAVGQLGLRELAAELARLRDDPDPVVRETAVWGLEQCAVSS